MPINSTRGAGSAKGFGLTAGSTKIYGIDYLVVAGGGGGGGGSPGFAAGGAGGYRTGTQSTFKQRKIYTITVGNGSAGRDRGYFAVAGGNSSLSGEDITTFSSSGGGGNNGTGGSAGGSNNGTSVPGNVGGYTPVEGYGCNGGTGAGGSSGENSGSTGGPATSNSITGSAVDYARGGTANNGVSGASNTGNGGGGQPSFLVSGGNGGSGVVILKILTVDYSGTTSGSPTVTTDGMYTIVKYTGDGTYTA